MTWITDQPPRSVLTHECFWVTRKDGLVEIQDAHDIKRFWHKKGPKGVIAWCNISSPEPYQPQKPKRREWVLSAESYEYDTDFKCRAFSFSTAIPRCAEHEIHVREVLPTDPTPEAVEEVAEQLESLIEVPGQLLTVADLEMMAAKLRGNE